MEKNYFVAIGDTFRFMLNHPAILGFTLLRLILFGLIYLVAIYFYSDLQLEMILKDAAPVFQTNCFGLVPCGLLVLYFFLAAGLAVSLATSRYVQAALRQKNISGFLVRFDQQLLAGCLLSLILTPGYFYIFKHFMTMPNIAPLLYFLTPIPLLMLLIVILPSFFLEPVLMQNNYGMLPTLTGALQVLRNNFGKTILFIIIFYVLAEAGMFVLLNAVNYQLILIQVLVCFGLAVLVTIKDIFKTLVAIK